MRRNNLYNNKLVIYGIGEILNKLVVFFFLPFAAFYLTTEEFGVAGIIIPLIQLMQGVIVFGLPISLLKFYNDYPQKKEIINFNVLVFYFTLLVLLSLFILVIKDLEYVKTLYIGKYKVSDHLYLILFTVFASATVQILLQKYQAEKKAFNFVILNTSCRIGLILLLLMNVYLLKNITTSKSLVIIMLINGVLFSIITITHLLKRSFYKIDKKILTSFIIIGFPLFINGILSYILQMNGRYILDEYIGIESVAAYSFVFSISQVIFLAIAVYNRLFLPDFFSVLARNENTYKFINNNLSFSTSILNLISIAFLPFGYLISTFYNNPLYSSFIHYLPILMILYIPYNLYLISMNYLAYHEKTKYTLLISAITGIASIFANILLIKHFGIEGLFFSQVLFQFIFSFLISFFLKKRNKKFIINYKSYIKGLIIPTSVLLILGILNFEKYFIFWIITSVFSTVLLLRLLIKSNFKLIK